MLDFIKNNFIYPNKYATHSEAIVISCFFNPQKSAYRLKAFNIFYESIKHLNHKIVECVIGDSIPQLEESENIIRVFTPSLLWHKESLLNNIIDKLPAKYKYVFWVDADVIFTNKNWLTEGVKQLQTSNIIQPFEYCAHLEKDETKPSFNMSLFRYYYQPNVRNNKVWRSFCATFVNVPKLVHSKDYNDHGHVGFAWGARRELLNKIELYDKALIGGADHIIAHAAAGQIPCECITKSFTEDIGSVNAWSIRFNMFCEQKIGYVHGNLYHIWHGDIAKRQYLKRIKDFTPQSKNITKRDKNGLYVTDNSNDINYMMNYFAIREVLDNNNNSQSNGFVRFGGGESGGGGSGGTWTENNQDKNESVDNNTNDSHVTTAIVNDLPSHDPISEPTQPESIHDNNDNFS